MRFSKTIPLLLVFFFISTTQALPVKDDFEASCPRAEFTRNFTENFGDRYRKERNTELIASELMLNEVKEFHEKRIDTLNQDNQSNPNFVAYKAVQELRKHNECLKQICFNIFKESNPRNINSEKTDSSKRWCQQKTEQLFELGKTEVLFGVNENFSRKERSLYKQKHVSLASRFLKYAQHWMPEVINKLQNFANKMPIFIRFPF